MFCEYVVEVRVDGSVELDLAVMCSRSDSVIEQYRRAECAPIRLERLSISLVVVVVGAEYGVLLMSRCCRVCCCAVDEDVK